MKNILLISSIYFLILIVFTSCEKKGCTDRNAVNYDVTANIDDGSCIICQKTIAPYDSMQLQLVDKRTTSPYYNDTVGIFYLNQYFDLYNDQVCGVQRNYINLNLQSLVAENMQVQFAIEDVLGPINFSHSGIAFIQPYKTTEFGLVEFVQYPYYKISLDSLKITLTGYILYN